MFRLNSPVMQLMARLFDLILLNLVFLLCCVPVVTIGASCTALHTVCLKYADGDEPPVLGTFFTAFRKNFVQSTLSWLVLFAAGAFGVSGHRPGRPDRRRRRAHAGSAGGGLAGAAGGGALSLSDSGPVSKYHPGHTIRANCRNALLLAVRHFPRTVLLALTVLIPLGLLLYGSTELFLLLGVLMLLMGGSVIAGIQSKILLPMFRQHVNRSTCALGCGPAAHPVRHRLPESAVHRRFAFWRNP